MNAINLADYIRDVPDFPKPGIVFKDITPMLANSRAFSASIDQFVERFKDEQIDAIIAVESRGFIFGGPLATRLDAAFIPVRKPGKLPYDKISQTYDLEYGTDTLEIHSDALSAGQRVLIVDDLLATGGTIEACMKLLEGFSVEIVASAFCIHLKFLGGEKRLGDHTVFSLLEY